MAADDRWEFWIDVGGTFTDCLAKTPDGAIRQHKLLSSGVTKGRVDQSNFHQYDVLRLDEAPVVDVHLVASTEAPGGIGEAGVPTLAPAVTNALFALTGKRVRKLPIRPEQLA